MSRRPCVEATSSISPVEGLGVADIAGTRDLGGAARLLDRLARTASSVVGRAADQHDETSPPRQVARRCARPMPRLAPVTIATRCSMPHPPLRRNGAKSEARRNLVKRKTEFPDSGQGDCTSRARPGSNRMLLIAAGVRAVTRSARSRSACATVRRGPAVVGVPSGRPPGRAEAHRASVTDGRPSTRTSIIALVEASAEDDWRESRRPDRAAGRGLQLLFEDLVPGCDPVGRR